MSASRSRRPSQNEQLLAILADGQWHTTRELIIAVPCVLHSRVHEINARGLAVVEHRGSGGGSENHEYRLAGPLAGSESVPPSSPPPCVDAGSVPVSGVGADGNRSLLAPGASLSSRDDDAAQLSLLGATA